MRDFTIAEAARMLGVTPDYLRVLEKQHRIPPARRIPGSRVFNEREVRYLRSLGVGRRLRRLRGGTEMVFGSSDE